MGSNIIHFTTINQLTNQPTSYTITMGRTRSSSKKQTKPVHTYSESEESDFTETETEESSEYSATESEGEEDGPKATKGKGKGKGKGKSKGRGKGKGKSNERKNRRRRHQRSSDEEEEEDESQASSKNGSRSKNGRSSRKKSKRTVTASDSETEGNDKQASSAGAEHVSKFGVSAGEPAAVAPAAMEMAVDTHDVLEGTGISLDPSKIRDISVISADRMKETITFQLGSTYFVKVGPVPYHTIGGTFDAMSFGKIITEKEGGKEKPIAINLPLKAISQIMSAFRDLHSTWETRRSPLSVEELTDMKKASGGKDINLVSRMQYEAPKEGFKIDANHIICGETVVINKTNSYEAITVCRLPKTNGANGKPTKKFSISFPLRFLPTLLVLTEFVNGLRKPSNAE